MFLLFVKTLNSGYNAGMLFLAKHKQIIIIFTLTLAFFYIYSFSLGPQSFSKFNSPDETANSFWILNYAQGHGLSYAEPLNFWANNLLRPRSVNVSGANVVPGSFLGQIIIYGSILKITMPQILPLLTPLFACLGVIVFYYLVSLLFNRQVGFISALLLLFFPGWWYYAARGMYHQILFITLLLLGLYLLLQTLQSKNSIDDSFSATVSRYGICYTKILLYFLSGCFVGLSVITRTSETVWIGFLLIIIFVVNFRKIYWPGFILFVCGGFLAVMPMFYYNQILYGSFVSAGYQSVIGTQGIGQVVSSGLLFKILVTPFGFDTRSILINAYNYLFRFLPLWSLGALFGFILFLLLPASISKIKTSKKILLATCYLLLIVYLLIFYGSWSLSDRIDQTTLSLGTSYLRYWLPIYLLGITFMAYFIYWVIRFFKYTWLKSIILFFIILFIFLPSANLVLTDTDESLLNIRQSLLDSQNKISLIKYNLPNMHAVVVTYKQADKIFFPDYTRLVTDLVVPADYLALARLSRMSDMYYYTFAPPQTVEYISQRDFEPYGLEIVDGQKIFDNDYLYHIQKIQPPESED